MSDSHYTATVQVNQTTWADGESVYNSTTRQHERKRGERKVTEVASFTLRADDLETLVARLGKHVELIEE